MEFASTNFIWLFLPACLILFYLAKWFLKETTRDIVCKGILLVFSLYFYYLAGWKGLIALAVSILLNYLGARGIAAFASRERIVGKTALLVVLIIINAQWLAFYKYFGLFTGKTIIMPLAFSFVTFQSISYIVDVFRGKVQADKNLLNYALSTTFFGQMSQGPILRYDDFGVQIAGQEKSFVQSKHQKK